MAIISLRQFRLFIGLLLILGLTACEVELYSGLSEKEGNEILALLLSHNIKASKLPGKDQTVILNVEETDIPAAVELLGRHGFPREHFTSLGEIFEKQGLISSPLEERVRFVYGLQQSIAETLSQVDGVVTARVHIVLPEEHPLDQDPEPSSASVFIKHRVDLGIEEIVPKIKMIVQNSVQGLDYEKITVALFNADEIEPVASTAPPLQHFFGIRITRDSAQQFYTYLGLGGIILLFFLIASGYLAWRLRQARRANAERAVSG